ncbi:uncharacterized protein LOC131629440 [Vicia villosa]|uniref:uncharacterized protein LOC131629440 n=1 Tax=Vicia villosa TaxID=3911 RepID=UPI00273C8AEC|nr:uncharacterized protein LOC131629440 [Vicia villosa]
MDQCKEKRDAVEVNAVVDDVSSPKAKEKVNEDLEAESLLAMAVIKNQLNGIHIDSKNHNWSPQTPNIGVFDPFAPASEDMVRAPRSRKYHEEMRNGITRKLLFCSATQHQDESVSE